MLILLDRVKPHVSVEDGAILWNDWLKALMAKVVQTSATAATQSVSYSYNRYGSAAPVPVVSDADLAAVCDLVVAHGLGVLSAEFTAMVRSQSVKNIFALLEKVKPLCHSQQFVGGELWGDLVKALVVKVIELSQSPANLSAAEYGHRMHGSGSPNTSVTEANLVNVCDYITAHGLMPLRNEFLSLLRSQSVKMAFTLLERVKAHCATSPALWSELVRVVGSQRLTACTAEFLTLI